MREFATRSRYNLSYESNDVLRLLRCLVRGPLLGLGDTVPGCYREAVTITRCSRGVVEWADETQRW